MIFFWCLVSLGYGRGSLQFMGIPGWISQKSPKNGPKKSPKICTEIPKICQNDKDFWEKYWEGIPKEICR